MKIEKFLEILEADFFTGVPDSQLKALCDHLHVKYGANPKHHIIASNEGNCVAIAAGYYLSTGKIPVVYMQNSGQGNALNPIASLISAEVYAIPTIFVVGWRGQPGLHDEPQHIFQGKITTSLLDNLEIATFILKKSTTEEEVQNILIEYRKLLAMGKSVAFVVEKGALTIDEKVEYANSYNTTREEILRKIVEVTGDNPIISTTGKTSRELFEIRECNNQSHETDFLTVGSMGHSSSIAMSVAINKPNTKVWCIDGDGAALMHMGSLALIGNISPSNLVHILINNEAHESVGGMPTVANTVDFTEVAKACGYKITISVSDIKELDLALQIAKTSNELTFIEIKASIGARSDLGRPTTTTHENKNSFIEYLSTK